MKNSLIEPLEARIAPAAVLSISAPAPSAEGDAGATEVSFLVSLTGMKTGDVTVRYATADGTATVGDGDYQSVAGTLTFSGSTTQQIIKVPVNGDLRDELSETFRVLLDTPTGDATIGTNSATATIQNDDIRIRASDVSILETDGAATLNFQVQLSGASTHPVTVAYNTVNGTATAGGDFTTTEGTLTFAPGQTQKTVAVAITGDQVGELDETFSLQLSNATNATISKAQGLATLRNDDTAFRIDDMQVIEGGVGSTTQAVFTVSLDRGDATGDLLVDVATQVGTATNTVPTGGTADFLAKTATLTFAPGETTKTFSVAVQGDADGEVNETFTARLSNARQSSGAALANAFARDTGTGTILNDDGFFFTVNDVTISEGDAGTANAIFLVRLSSAAMVDAKVDVRTMDGTAISTGATADYDALVQTLTFSAGTTQQIVSVPIRGDQVAEATEAFQLLLSNATFTATTTSQVTILKSTGTGTITDDGDPTPTISIGAGTLLEGNNGTSSMTFEVTLSNGSSDFVSVNFDTKDGTGTNAATVANGDYGAISNGTLTFEPGQTRAQISVPILGDVRDEADETFGVTLKTPNGATLGVAEAIGTIRNDEISVNVGDSTIVEGNNGTQTITFQVSLNQAPVGHDVRVNFTTVDGTAISTGNQADYVARAGTLTFLAGGAATQQVAITVNGDARIEPTEAFVLQLTSATNAVLADSQGTGTITNDEAAPVISIGNAQLTEGDTGTLGLTFAVSLNSPSASPVTVRAQTQNGTAVVTSDYTAVDQTITFQPGETTKFFTVPVVGDTIDESTENFQVQLSAPTNGTLGTAVGTGTILDSDQPAITIANSSIVEGASGTQLLTFTASLSKAATRPVTVNYTTANGSAVSGGAGADYTATSGTLSFAAGATTQTFTVPIQGDTVAGEGTERFFVNLSNAQNGTIAADTRGVGFIVDDESTLTLQAVGETTVNEELSGTGDDVRLVKFQVVRGGDLSKAASVDFTTVDGTATSTGARPDFTAQFGTINFAPESRTSEMISVPITRDLNYENNETFQVKLSSPVNAAIIDNGAPALSTAQTVTIVSNDLAPTVSIGDVEITEGNSGTKTLSIPVTLSAANEVDNQVSVDFDLMDNDARSAMSGNFLQDYKYTVGTNEARSGTVFFAKGQTAQTIAVLVNGDTRDEADAETFAVTLSNQKNGSVVQANGITDATATATILDDDATPTLTFSGTTGGNQSVNEGNSGSTLANFTVNLSAVSERDVSVAVQTADGTAVGSGAGADYQPLAGSFRLNYVAGSSSTALNFSVPINGDTTNETSETFQVVLSDARFAQISDAGATVTIINTEDAPPSIVVNDVSLAEGNAGAKEMVFTVSLSAASGQTVSVDFATKDGTAFSTGPLADFSATKGTVTFAPGELTKEVRVSLLGDTYVEADELFSVELTGAKNGTVAKGSGSGTILNDGDTTVGIAVRDAFRVEGDSGSSSMAFTVELASPRSVDTTFTADTRGGTAVTGVDFTKVTGRTGTITAGSRSTTINVPIVGDQTFESTENFFLDLSDVPAGVQVVNGSGRGTIFNDDLRRLDNRTIQFIDVDGDLATVRVSQGFLSTSDLFFSQVNSIGGRQLQAIDFTDDGLLFNGTDLRVTARAQAGFLTNPQGVAADGLVNVGSIRAAIPQSDVLQFTAGIDFGTVKIDGDLGKIVAGDTGASTAIQRLQVRSMGALGTATQGSGGDVTSQVLGPIGSLVVRGDFAGTLRVIGEQFGRIDNLQIDGALLGGTRTSSGQIFFTGSLQKAYIGSIVGGTGADSGSISGSFNANATIGNIFVAGGVLGGNASGSGEITAPTITTVRVGSIQGGVGTQSGVIVANDLGEVIVRKDVTGGTGANSGEIFASNRIDSVRMDSLIGGGSTDAGSVVTNGTLGKIRISGGVFGGVGAASGSIQVTGSLGMANIDGITGGSGSDSGHVLVGGKLRDLRVGGDIQGGTGNGSGGVDISGKLGSGVVTGSILGGDTTALTATAAPTTLLKSGFLTATNIQKLRVQGNLEAGTDNGVGLAASGTIRAEKTIGFLRIDGDVLGNGGNAAIISAAGTKGTPLAIRRLVVGGEMQFAEILAGYGTDATLAKERGTASFADARIGTVKIVESIQSSSIVAGVATGADNLFGTNDDVLSGTGDAAKSFSKIARIVIKGTVDAGTATTGIVAQHLASIQVNGTAVPLTAGPGNDLARDTLLAPASGIRVFELPLPT